MEIPKDVLRASSAPQMDQSSSVSPVAWKQKLLQAQDYARRGLYGSAERVLMELAGTDEYKTAVLDLKAKMLAQRGRYAEAEKCWLEAVSLDPGNLSFRKSLNALVESRQNLLIRLAKSKVSAVLVIVLLLAVIFNLTVFRDQSNYDNLFSRLESFQEAVPGAEQKDRGPAIESEEKYWELYNQREKEFLETESKYADRIDSLLARVKELESAREVIKANPEE